MFRIRRRRFSQFGIFEMDCLAARPSARLTLMMPPTTRTVPCISEVIDR